MAPSSNRNRTPASQAGNAGSNPAGATRSRPGVISTPTIPNGEWTVRQFFRAKRPSVEPWDGFLKMVQIGQYYVGGMVEVKQSGLIMWSVWHNKRACEPCMVINGHSVNTVRRGKYLATRQITRLCKEMEDLWLESSFEW